MYTPNNSHLQPALISAVSELPIKQQKRLQESWADMFYREFFCRINEEIFSVLYSSVGSRPNFPINILIGLEALKAGKGWSDEQLIDEYNYNLQVRFALGVDRLGDQEFDIRTLYNFRQRLSQYNVEKGINLLEKAFEGIVDEQIKSLKVKTEMQRMDSTQIASNIVSSSRLQLLVESLHRLERILKDGDKERLADKFEPYTRDSAGHYSYRVKGKEAVREHMQAIGKTIHGLLSELREKYREAATYQVMERLFAENFTIEESLLRVKENTELSSSSLQSLDDLEASYRVKGTKHYKGYVANITETCDPENDFQLITKVQVAPNNVEDAQLMVEAIPNLKERTKIATLYTDGGFGGPDADHVTAENDIEQIQTGIRGRIPDKSKLNLVDFEINQSDHGKPTKITCPQGQVVAVNRNNKKNGFVAHFATEICEQCPLVKKCPAKPGKRDPRWHLRFSEKQMHVSQRRHRSMIHKIEARNLRAAVEASVRQVKHPFPASKLPVRGLFRMGCMIIGSAMMSNIRRIQRFRVTKLNEERQQKEAIIGLECTQGTFGSSFLILQKRLIEFISRTLAPFRFCFYL